MFFLLLSFAQADVQPITNATLALSGNRTGPSLEARHGVYKPMFEKEDSVLFQGTGVRAQGSISVSPAMIRGGAQVTLSPLAILDLTAYGQYDSYFGNFQTIIDYDSADYNYGSNQDIADYVEQTGRQSAGTGWHGGGAMTLKAKAGPVIILSKTDLSYWAIQQDDAQGDWFFEREKEVMMKLNGDSLIEENALVMYEHIFEKGTSLRVGSMTTYRHSITADDSLLRTGLIAMYTTPSAWSHTLIVQPYLQDRAFASAFPPYAAYALRYAR